MAWCPHCVQDRPIQRQTFDGFCSYCLTSGHESWCRGPVPNALDVCSYCNTHVFARARDAAMYGRLIAAEEQGRKERETQRQQAREAAQREWAERRQRNVALSIAGIVVGLIVFAVAYLSC
jgi:hypothetical protein